MKNDNDFIHLPELFLEFDKLKKHLKTLYNIDIVRATTIDKPKDDYKLLGSYKKGSVFEQKFRKAKIDFKAIPDKIPGYVKIYVGERDIDKVKYIIRSGRAENGKPIMDIYERKTQERLALIDDMMSEAEKYNQLEANELKADISDFLNEDTQYYAIDRLLDINQKSAKIDYFLSKARSLGWADQYARDGKMFTNGGGTGNAVAMEIIRQLGGMNRLNVMTGAYNFVALDRGVSFRIKNQSANYIKITLSSLDLYDLEVGRIRGDKYTVVYEQSGLYFDMLKPEIEKATGMTLTMPRIRFDRGGMMKAENGTELLQTATINADGKVYTLRVNYSREYKTANINIVDDMGYPSSIERMPIGVISKLYSMLDKVMNSYAYKAADGAEIDAMVSDWKAVKGVLSKSSGMPNELKVLDIESNSVHNPVFIDFNENYVIMENKEFGRTRNTLDKVKFFFQTSSIDIPKPMAMPVLTPAEAMKQKAMPEGMQPQAPYTPPAPSYAAPIRQQPQELPTFAPKKQSPVTRVDPTIKPSIAAKVLQEMWAEAKGQGLVLISQDYMNRIEQAMFGEIDVNYEEMIKQILDWLYDNDIILRSKPFMKKVRAAIENK